jgi:hypothetical protein
VWKHKYPVAMMKALWNVIHKKATPEEAVKIFEDEKKIADGK